MIVVMIGQEEERNAAVLNQGLEYSKYSWGFGLGESKWV